MKLLRNAYMCMGVCAHINILYLYIFNPNKQKFLRIIYALGNIPPY